MPAEDDYNKFSEFAKEIGLEGEDFEGFVNSAMKRKGYKPRTAWDDPEPEDGGKGDGDFFSRGGKQREQRQVGGDRGDGGRGGSSGGQQRGGSGWQYDN